MVHLMSRSAKHTPIMGWAASCSNAWFRSNENQAKRHRVKQLLIMQQYDNLPHEKEYGNEYASPRDGKTYFGDMLYIPCIYCRYAWHWRKNVCECTAREEEFKKYMRK